MITGISRQATQFSRLRFLTWALWIINLFFFKSTYLLFVPQWELKNTFGIDLSTWFKNS